MAGVVRQVGAVEVQVIGAGALNQAIKAIAIARGYVAPSGIELVCVPTFHDIEIDGEGRTAIRLTVEDRERRVVPAAAVSGGSTVDLRAADPAATTPPPPAPAPAVAPAAPAVVPVLPA